MAELILIRHGESVANSERRFTVRDDEPLTSTGVDQARETGRRLISLYEPVAIYASRYRRAVDTAQEIGRSFGLEPSVIEGLHEQSFGDLRGAPYEEWYDIHAPRPHPREAWRRQPPGGESLSDVASRAGAVLDSLARRHLGEQVIVVSHGGVMAALRGWVRGRYDDPPESTPNAGGYRLRASVAESRLRYEGPLELFVAGPE